MRKGLRKQRYPGYLYPLKPGPRIYHHPRPFSRLVLLPRTHCQKSIKSNPRVPLDDLAADSRLLIPAKDLPSLFTATARASVKKTFAGKNNAMSTFLAAGAKSLSKCIIDGKKTALGKKLCEDHEPLEMVIAAEKQAMMERLGGEYNLLEGACRSCQGNIGREVLCTNLYCPWELELMVGIVVCISRG